MIEYSNHPLIPFPESPLTLVKSGLLFTGVKTPAAKIWYAKLKKTEGYRLIKRSYVEVNCIKNKVINK